MASLYYPAGEEMAGKQEWVELRMQHLEFVDVCSSTRACAILSGGFGTKPANRRK